MAYSRNRLQHSGTDTFHHLQRQIEGLRNDIAALSGDAAYQGHHALDDLGHHAAELLDEAGKQGRVVANRLSRQLASTGKAVQRDPLPVVVAIGTLVLVSSLLMRRR
jgi:hypothetical protein